MRHSPEAIANYVNTFVRCVQLQRRGLQAGQIAFLLRRSKGLIERYLALQTTCEQDQNHHYHLEELLLCDGRGWQDADEKKTSAPENTLP